MQEKLTQEQIGLIIAEVQELKTRRDEENLALGPEQVKEILQELNLPPELLDEAMIQVRRRQMLEEKQRRNKFKIGGIVAVVVVAIAAGIFFIQQNNSTLAKVSAQQDRISFLQDDGTSIKTISRQENKELLYRVTLKDAAIGKKLKLSCDWINPSGQVVKQNSYETREITKSIWDTQCRYTMNAAAMPGQWKVQMLIEGRILSDETFEVR
jgi:hypothetical protein